MKKFTGFFLFAIAALFMMSANVDAKELEATISTGRAISNKYLTDSDYSTTVSFKKGEQVKVEAKDGSTIKAYYVIWNDPISEYTVDTDAGQISAGQDGFLHEYVEFDVPTSAFVINIPKDNLDIARIRIFSDSEVPDDVQVWNPPCEKADILLVPSHADDEILFFGGIIPTYAVERDCQIQVAYMTEFWTTTPVREHEKLDGLWTAGLRNYPVSSEFRDVYAGSIEAARQLYNESEMVDFLVDVIDRFEPQVVVTHDVNGEYGHGYHMLTNAAVGQAIEKATWQVPKTYYHLLKDNAIRLNLRVPIESMGGRTAVEIAADAYKQHVSQQWCWFYVSDDYEYSCADFGLYRTLVGADTDDDMMCNLKSYAVQEEERLAAESADGSLPAKELTPVIEALIFPDLVGTMTDSDYNTSMPFATNDVITVKSKEKKKISGVYIQWNATFDGYQIETDQGTIECGKNGFLHDYVEFENPVSYVKIKNPVKETSVSEIRIFTAGSLPKDVQVWDAPCDKADFLLISAHSDDELIFLGSIIPTYIEKGCQIQVAYITEYFTTTPIREHEKLDGLWAAGIRNYPVCGNFHDENSMDIETAKSIYGENAFVGFIADCYDRFKPQVVVTHDKEGEYGHGCHRLTYDNAVKALDKATWNVPKFYVHLFDKKGITIDLYKTIESMGGRTVLEIVNDAYDYHVSQQENWPEIAADSTWPCDKFGLYRSLVGKDKDNDMMSGLVPYAQQTSEMVVPSDKANLGKWIVLLLVAVILLIGLLFVILTIRRVQEEKRRRRRRKRMSQKRSQGK